MSRTDLGRIVLAVLTASASTWAHGAEEGMPSMPKAAPKKVTVIRSKEEGEKLLKQRGYGEREEEVRMMNLMMVEGSEHEGMDMSGHGHGHEPR